MSAVAQKKKIALDPEIVITSPTGEELVDVYGETAGTAKASVEVTPGIYSVVVKPGDGYIVKGGFSYELEILSTGAASTPVAGAEAEAPTGETIVIDAPLMAAEFLKNADAALLRFDNQPVQVKGVVQEVDADPAITTVVLDVPVIDGKFSGIAANLGPKVKVKKGQVVTLTGLASVDAAGDLMVIINNAELISGTSVAKAPAAKAPAAPAKRK